MNARASQETRVLCIDRICGVCRVSLRSRSSHGSAISLQDITYAENYLAQGDLATATPLLERLVELAEEYIDAECKTEENRQYFSFDSKFERLAYRRVEKDPRELVQVEVPFDRLYSDMAYATFASRIM